MSQTAQVVQGADLRLRWETVDTADAEITLDECTICFARIGDATKYEFTKASAEVTVALGETTIVVPGATTAGWTKGPYEVVFKGTTAGADVDIDYPFPILTVIENPCP